MTTLKKPSKHDFGSQKVYLWVMACVCVPGYIVT
jgi:hypothetical protein